MPISENLTPLFQTADHGIRAFVDGLPLIGIFDRVDVTAVETKGYHPVLTCRAVDAPGVAEGSEVWVDGTVHTVAVIESDGLGLLRLILQLGTAAAGEGVAWNFDGGYIQSPTGELMNDHALPFVSETGLWHDIAIKGTLGSTAGSAYFTHRTSPDLTNWTQLADIQVGTGVNLNWRAQVWAPHIIRNPVYGVAGASTAAYKWLMFFAAADYVTAQVSTSAQKIGIAGCSSDALDSWTVLNSDAPIYWTGMSDVPNGGSYPSGAPWAGYEAAWCRASRDPDIFFDGTDYYMTMTAQNETFTRNVLGLAKFNGGAAPDFLKLRHASAELVEATASGSWRLESSRVLKKDGIWHIFVKGTDGTRHQSASAMAGPWGGAGTDGDAITNGIYEETLVGSGTSSAEAAEIEQIDGDLYVASGHRIYGSGASGISFHQFHLLDFTGVVAGGHPTSRHMGLITGKLGTFEGSPTGDLRWSIIDDFGASSAFRYQPVWGDQAAAAGYDPSGMEGDAYIATHFRHFYPWATSPWQDGAEWTDYTRKGAIQSSTFRITRDRMSLLVGGGKNRWREFVALVNAADGRVLFAETGDGDHKLRVRAWDLSTLMGLDVYLVVADLGTATMDCIACDSIREYDSATESDPVSAVEPFAIGGGNLISVLLAKGGIS